MSYLLTQNEFNVAYLVAQGKSTKQAAYQNRITTRVAMERLKNVYKRLDLCGQIDLRKAFEDGRFYIFGPLTRQSLVMRTRGLPVIIKCESCSAGKHSDCDTVAWVDLEGQPVYCTCRGDDHFDAIEEAKHAN